MNTTEKIVATVRGDIISLINMFPDIQSQEEMKQINNEIEDFTLNVARYFPGFVSANLFKSENSVTNIVQWESEEALHTFLSDPKVKEHLGKFTRYVKPAVKICRLYKVIPAASNHNR